MKKLLKWGAIAFGALIVIGIIASALGGGKEEKTGGSNEAKQVSTEEKKESAVKIGEPLQVGEVKWIAENPQKTAEIKSSNEYVAPAKANGVFVIVDLTAELTGKDSGTVDSSQFKIVDSKGRSFDATTESDVFVAIDSENLIFLKQINPNVPVKGKAVFDIAADATGLKLQINDLRFGSDEKGFVELGI
ncbi:MAG: DUF4352 domain-containing protein [Candidatus Aquicultorales bacterium]